MSNENKKFLTKLGIVLVILIGLVCSPKIYYELTKDSLVLDELVKVEYVSALELFDEIGEYPWNDKLNNYAYTIKEDNLTDDYDTYLRETSNRDKRWLVYYLLENNEYCLRKKHEDLNICYMSDYTYIRLNLDEPKMQKELGIAILEISSGDQIIYTTEKTDIVMEAIDNAYIISQGSATEGYEEAMKWSHDTARGNGSKFSNFEDGYYDTVKEYKGELELLSEMSIEDTVESYEEYRDVIYDISSDLKLGVPKKNN